MTNENCAPIKMTKTYTREEVADHNNNKDAWIIIDGKVYDVTKFAMLHPGGKGILLNVAGQDATKEFDAFHKKSVLDKYSEKLCIGEIEGESKPGVSSLLSSGQQSNPKYFGDLTPYGDPAWYQGHHTLYYNDTHRRFRVACREFIEKNISPFCHEWDETLKFPKDLHEKAFEAGLYPGSAGCWPTKYAGTKIAGGMKPEEWDYFHEYILLDELMRCGSTSGASILGEGIGLGLPPLLHFGSEQLKDRYVEDIVKGKKIICLAITEPTAGSDVANIQCTAELTPDGKHYIVNGEKKWITSVAVRTGKKGMGGISLLVIERGPGVKTRHIKCMGLWAAGTAFVTFDNVKVPVENLIGKENQGFKYIMYNFNHERFIIIVETVRLARICYEESFNYAHKRKTFGKPLIEHQVIRAKLGNMIRQIEACQAWTEHLTYQMCKMSHLEGNMKLGGPLALLKVQATTTLEFCAREAVQIFGGLGYTRGGQGEKVERIYRESRSLSILGGSEEIMLDLGVRQAIRMNKSKL